MIIPLQCVSAKRYDCSRGRNMWNITKQENQGVYRQEKLTLLNRKDNS